MINDRGMVMCSALSSAVMRHRVIVFGCVTCGPRSAAASAYVDTVVPVVVVDFVEMPCAGGLWNEFVLGSFFDG